MANVFVSSRMDEVYLERKRIVELIKESGHTPLFFEVEPFLDDDMKARERVDGLIEDADAMVQIHYLTAGVPRKAYDLEQDDTRRIPKLLTPIEYEFTTFRTRNRGPLILVIKDPEQYPPDIDPKEGPLVTVNKDLKWLTARATQSIKDPRDGVVITLDHRGFADSPDPDIKLNGRLRNLSTEQFLKALEDLVPEPEVENREPKPKPLVIQYSGPDDVGLLRTLSGVIFHTFRLNIEYLSYASVKERAAACFHCVPSRPARKKAAAEIDPKLIKSNLDDAIRSRHKHKRFSDAQTEVRADALGHDPWLVRCELSDARSPEAECYMEIRHYDLPGQVYAISRKVAEMGLNIDELHLHPHEAGDRTQRVLRLWVSGQPGTAEAYSCSDLIRSLEMRLSRLIGVRCVTAYPLRRGIR